MKRDMDLIRKILFEIERLYPFKDYRLETIEIENYDNFTIYYHLCLLKEADLIEGTEEPTINSQREFYPTRLTWKGYDFLDAARNDTIWKQAKAFIKDKGMGLSFDVLKGVLILKAKQELGL